MQSPTGLDDYLVGTAPGRSEAARGRRADWHELLILSPRGYKTDQPSVEAYRRRLSALARSLATAIEAETAVKV